MKRHAEVLEPDNRVPYTIGPAVVPLTEEMRRLMASERFDVHALVAQKPAQTEADTKCAKRYMKGLVEPIEFDQQVLRASVMATTRLGARQFTHYDMSPDLAKEKRVGVYIQNLGREAFILFVRIDGVDVPVTVPPGMAIRFSADTPHAGSGEIHYHRLYVLYAESPLSEEDARAVCLDAELLVAVP